MTEYEEDDVSSSQICKLYPYEKQTEPRCSNVQRCIISSTRPSDTDAKCTFTVRNENTWLENIGIECEGGYYISVGPSLNGQKEVVATGFVPAGAECKIVGGDALNKCTKYDPWQSDCIYPNTTTDWSLDVKCEGEEEPVRLVSASDILDMFENEDDHRKRCRRIPVTATCGETRT